MIIAQQKQRTNLAEYIIYMWQLEDLLRGLQLDMGKVDRLIVSAYDTDDDTRAEIRYWYDNLIEMMKQEKIEVSGHLQVVKNRVNELTEMHFYLLHQQQDRIYHQLVTQAAPNLLEYRHKSHLGEDISDVELALHALYGQLMLKLQKKEVHSQTKHAMDSFSSMLAYLAAKYRQCQEKEYNDEK